VLKLFIVAKNKYPSLIAKAVQEKPIKNGNLYPTPKLEAISG
jgi:hypothetical protein